MSLLVSLLVLSIVVGPTTIIVWKLRDKYCTTIKMEWPTTMKTDIASPSPKVCNDDVSFRYEWISLIVIIRRKDGAIDCSIDASYYHIILYRNGKYQKNLYIYLAAPSLYDTALFSMINERNAMWWFAYIDIVGQAINRSFIFSPSTSTRFDKLFIY